VFKERHQIFTAVPVLPTGNPEVLRYFLPHPTITDGVNVRADPLGAGC
jgi:hypothetical protein